MSRAWAGGSTRRWRLTRAAILLRDHGVCQLRLDGCTHTATEVHHVKGKAYGDNPQWLVASCRPCNLAVGHPGAGDPPTNAITRW